MAITRSTGRARPSASAKPPAALADFQHWFARAVSRTLMAENKTRPRGVDGSSLAHEADARLRSRGGMSGLERLEVYNRQYWFRLITCLQEEFPCTLHVIGLNAFNAWVIRYLNARPPGSPYLADLDGGFAAFLRARHRGADREKVLEAAGYDAAFSRAFDAAEARPPVPSEAGAPGTQWVRAPHVTPLWLRWDFAAYRALCRDDEALTGRFPLRRRVHGFCLHRQGSTLYEKEISRPEFLLLRALEKPRTLEQVFRAAGREASARDMKAMEQSVGEWFRDWIELRWIGKAT